MQSPSEGLPPEPEPESADDPVRAELDGLSRWKLCKRAEALGVPEQTLEDAVGAADPEAVLIDLIVEAESTAVADPDLVRTRSADRVSRETDERERLLIQLAATEGAMHSSIGEPNIMQRLNAGEWKKYGFQPRNWWQTEMAEQVNRLRVAARIRESLPSDTQEEIPELYPQLVVLGDGNTGKSTVLNRFAEFCFSAVSDGVCTRRPVRLQLRPVQAENRARMQAEDLLAFCKMEDTEDGHEQEFTMRSKYREEDEKQLRLAVESRASEQVREEDMTTQEAHDRQYIDEELVITIEADQMIYFDLIDLPGLHNTSQRPKQMVKRYITEDTLPRTFVLLFSEHKKGDTLLDKSLAFAIMQEVRETLGQAAHEEFLAKRCMGVLTKVDKELESNSTKPAVQYNSDAAAKLKSSLLCKEHPKHMMKWVWVAVVNPNSEEQQQNMTFDEAHRKENWFFDTLFADDADLRELCDINNFRAKLVRLYEEFVADHIRLAAPTVFAKVVKYGNYMNSKWDWHAQQECYEDPYAMVLELNKLVQGMVASGKLTRLPTSAAEILIRDDVLECATECSNFIDRPTALQNTKKKYIKLMANVGETLIEQVHWSTKQLKYKRFVSLSCHLVKVIVFIVKEFLEQTEEAFDSLISEEEKKYEHLDISERPVEGMVGSLIKCGQSQLSQLGAIIDNLPVLPSRFMRLDPPDFLEHATPKVEMLAAPFGLICNASGLVTSSTGKISPGSTIVQIGGTKFSLELMLEMSNSPAPVKFAYVQSGCSIISDDVDVGTPFLYHEAHVSSEFLEERERFLCHRRAAELLVLVFDKETTRPSGKPIAERGNFERLVHGRKLVCLDPTCGNDPDWYKQNHNGTLPSKKPTGSNGMDFVIKLSGMCCTPGCKATHDTAFSPCGHTVCCWECAGKVDECPVCAMDLTRSATGIRPARDLCYDHPPTEQDHRARVLEGKERDRASQEAVEDEYKEMLIKFKYEDDQLPDGEATYIQALEKQSQKRAELAARNDGSGLLPGQACIWPRFDELEKERAKSQRAMEAKEQRMVALQRQSGAEMQQLKRVHEDTLTQLRQQHHQQRVSMLTYVKTLEDVLSKTDICMKSSLLASTVTDGRNTCSSVDCSVVFLPGEGILSSGKVPAYNCATCGDAFCDACAPAPGYVFQTGGKDKVRRVCARCRDALDASGGVRSRLIPATRPDGTRFGF